MGDITSTPQPLFCLLGVSSLLFAPVSFRNWRFFSPRHMKFKPAKIYRTQGPQKARYKLVFSITIKIKRAIFWSHAHGKEFIQMYKCLPSVVQSLKTVLKKVIMSHRYKFSHFILPCDINILLFSFAKVRESKEFCTTKVSRFHLPVPLAA